MAGRIRPQSPPVMPAGYLDDDPSASVASGGMNLRQLQYFVAVAEDGGFRQAAARLNVAQPALSRQLQGMEAELGLVLLDRNTRRVALTPAGDAYLRAVRAVLETVSDSVRRARLASRGRVGRCVIAAPRPALAAGHLSRAAERMAALYPEIELAITEADIPDHWELLRRGEVDLLVGVRPASESEGIESEPLWTEVVRCALLPASHPLADRATVTLTELRAETFLTMEPTLIPDLWAPTQRALDRAGVGRSQVRIARSMSAIRTLVAAGHGWSLVSSAYLEQPPTGTVVIEVDDFAVDLERTAQWRTDDQRSLLGVVRDVLREVCAGESPSGGVDAPTLSGEGDAFGLPRALELRHLEYLRSAVDAASIGGAAAALGIAQPVLSRQLRDLERAMGIELLERGRRGVRATAAGELLIRETSRVTRDLDEALQAANRAHRGSLGQCMLATITTPMGIQVVASVLAECTRTEPELAIEIVELPSTSQHTALLSATVDLGFSAVSSRMGMDTSIVREHMLDDPLDCVLVARDHPLALRDRVRLSELEALPFLFASRDLHPEFHDQVMHRLRRLELRSSIDVTYQSLHLRWARAAEGKGWCLGFRSQRAHPPRGTIALPVDGLSIPWGMELLWRAGESREMVMTLIASFRRAAALARREPVLDLR
jgi:DNA-binding transcriptional LysR family regulator